MSSFIANNIKINLYSVSIKFFIVALFLFDTINSLSYTTIICLFVILLTQQFTILLTMEIFKPQLFSSHTTQLYTRLTEFLLLVACFVLFSLMKVLEVERSGFRVLENFIPTIVRPRLTREIRSNKFQR